MIEYGRIWHVRIYDENDWVTQAQSICSRDEMAQLLQEYDGYDYATFRNASKAAKWMNDYYVKWGQKYRFQVKQVKVTVEVTQ